MWVCIRLLLNYKSPWRVVLQDAKVFGISALLVYPKKASWTVKICDTHTLKFDWAKVPLKCVRKFKLFSKQAYEILHNFEKNVISAYKLRSAPEKSTRNIPNLFSIGNKFSSKFRVQFYYILIVSQNYISILKTRVERELKKQFKS
jgi:hypothetical protein